MDAYTWHKDPLMKKLTVECHQKYSTAYLEAPEGLPTKSYAQIHKALITRGYTAIADEFEGRHVLRIRGFKDGEELKNALKDAKIMTAEADETELDYKHEKSSWNLQDWVKKNTMAAAGFSYLAADFLAFGSGYVREINGKKDMAAMGQGLSWALTSAMLAIYGTRNPKRQMENLYYKMETHLKENGTPLTDEDRTTLTHLKGNTESFYDRSVNFIYKHPVELNNSIQGFGALLLTIAGWNQKSRDLKDPLKTTNNRNYLKVAAGVSVMVGFWGSMLMKENPEAALTEEQKEQRMLDRLAGKDVPEPEEVSLLEDPINWVRQKPLRIAGYAAILNNILVGYSGWVTEPNNVKQLQAGEVALGKKLDAERSIAMATNDYKTISIAVGRDAEYKRLLEETNNRSMGMKFDRWTPFPNIVANALYAQAPKDRRGVLKEDGYVDELLSVAAYIYKDVPAEKRDSAIVRFAGFMSDEEELKSTSDEIENAIKERISALEKNPWSQATQQERTENITKLLSRNEKPAAPTNHTQQVTHLDKGIGQAMSMSPIATA